MAEQKKRHPDQKDVENGSHDCHHGIGLPESSVQGCQTGSDPLSRGFLLRLYFQGRVSPFLFPGQSEKLDKMEYQPKNKYDKSD
jgi:hypothetical protein